MSSRVGGTWIFGTALLGLGLMGVAFASPVGAQWYSPQSDRDLRLSWDTQRIGPTRVLILGSLQNQSDSAASGVVLRAEGLDRAGRVVSRARGYVSEEVPPLGTSSFEIRLVPSGSEQSYRVRVESFEFVSPRGAGTEAP